MSNNRQSTFKIVDIDFKNGWTITTLTGKNELNQQHIPLSVIENFFGGKNKKIQGDNK